MISVRGILSHGGLRKGNPDSQVMTGFYRSPGIAAETQILELLGPPSQVMNLGDQVIFYYIMEKTEGKGGYLLAYNWNNKKVIYDRAIFFFDKNRVLKDYALSKENIEYEKSP